MIGMVAVVANPAVSANDCKFADAAFVAARVGCAKTIPPANNAARKRKTEMERLNFMQVKSAV